MDPKRLAEMLDIVEHFLGATPTDKEIIDYCESKGVAAIDAGTLEDWTFQYDVDKLRNASLPLICNVIAAWTPPSGFATSQEQQAAFKDLEKRILAIFEDQDVRFNIATSVLENLASIGSIIKSASLLATDKKVAIANRFIENHFNVSSPNKVSVGSYAQLCRDLAKKAGEAVQ